MSSRSSFDEPASMARIAHLTPLLCALSVATAVPRWLYADGWVIGVSDTVGFLVLIGMMIGIFHSVGTRLCEACAAATPLDPARTVKRNRWALWLAHKVYDRSFQFVLVLLVAILGVGQLAKWLDMPWLNAPFTVLTAGFMFGCWRHHQLQPWCPYCGRWDDGGEREVVPDPDPAGSKTGD